MFRGGHSLKVTATRMDSSGIPREVWVGPRRSQTGVVLDEDGVVSAYREAIMVDGSIAPRMDASTEPSPR